jgi:hypothetical protein
MSKTILYRIVGALLLVAALGSSSACLGPYDSAGISVAVGPPPLRVDARIAAPGPGYLWVDGYWDWGHGDWVWVPGAWARAPHARATWVRPGYHQRHGRWYYSRGHWR